jgi:uncharacterized protein (TIGR00730 family)
MLFFVIIVVIIYLLSLEQQNNKNNKTNITVFCSSKDDIDKKYKTESEKLINLLDVDKITLVYGGNNTGLMRIVNDTYKKKNGQVISVNYKKFAKMHNDYIYDTLEERQNKLVELGDAYLILPGGLGTAYELFQVLVKNNINDFRKKIYIFNVYGFFDDLLTYITKLNKIKFISGGFNSMNMYISNNAIDIANKINSN